MKKRQRTPTEVLARRGAEQETRKAANVLAHAIRLGRAKGLVEDRRGECMTVVYDKNGKRHECRVTGRRFRRIWFEQTAPDTAPKIGILHSTAPKCVLCISRELRVI